MQQAGYHHTNMLATQFRTNMNTQSSQMLAMINDPVVTDNNPLNEEISSIQ